MIYTKYKILNAKYKRGFTLIEMMVTLGILVFISTMVIAYSRRGETINALVRQGDQMIFELRRTQDKAMLVSQKTSDGGAKEICGWGIYIESSMPQEKYFLFSDFCSSTLPSGERAGNGRYDEGEEAETLTISRGLEIFETNFSSIVFIPPEPKVKFSPYLNPGVNGRIAIRIKDQPNFYYEILISSAGQIYKQVQGI